MQPIFDRNRIRRQRLRTQGHFFDYSFLHQAVFDDMRDRLNIVQRTYQNVLQVGMRPGILGTDDASFKNLFVMDLLPSGDGCVVAGDEEYLRFAPNSFGLIFNPLTLHTVNDLPGALIQLRRALTPDGLFMASLIGENSLHELRQSLSESEIDICGGLSPRVAPMIGLQQMAGLMQRAGFSLPVADIQKITVTYDDPMKLLRDLRGMGENRPMIADKDFRTPAKLFQNMSDIYRRDFTASDGRVTATFDIIHVMGWAPHNSQQKPLRAGSAKHSLADALNTQEIQTGDIATP